MTIKATAVADAETLPPMTKKTGIQVQVLPNESIGRTFVQTEWTAIFVVFRLGWTHRRLVPSKNAQVRAVTEAALAIVNLPLHEQEGDHHAEVDSGVAGLHSCRRASQ